MSGSIPTVIEWSDELMDRSSQLFTTKKSELELEMKNLFELSSDVMTADVTVTGNLILYYPIFTNLDLF